MSINKFRLLQVRIAESSRLSLQFAKLNTIVWE